MRRHRTPAFGTVTFAPTSNCDIRAYFLDRFGIGTSRPVVGWLVEDRLSDDVRQVTPAICTDSGYVRSVHDCPQFGVFDGLSYPPEPEPESLPTITLTANN